MDIIPIIGILATSAMTVLIVYFISRARVRRVEVQVEMQSRLIDRFATADKLTEFLQSPEGRQFITGSAAASSMMTRERLMTGLNRAIMLTTLGAAFLCLAFYSNDDFAGPAIILLFLGVGYFIATFVSYKLSAKLMGESK